MNRKKFAPPVAKNSEPKYIEEYNPNSDYAQVQNNYYSFGGGSFANSNPQYEKQSPPQPQEFDGNDMSAYMQDINKIVETSQNQPQMDQTRPFNPCIAAAKDPDVSDYFSKLKAGQQKPRKEEVKQISHHHTSDEGEDSFDGDDEDAILDQKIKALSAGFVPIKEVPQEVTPDYSNKKINITTESIMVKQAVATNRSNEIASKLSREFEAVNLRDTRPAGDITCTEEEATEDDILGLLNIETAQEPEAKPKIEENDLAALLGKKRKHDQMESDTIQIPQPEIKDKRYKYDFDGDDLMEISKIVNQKLNEGLEGFEEVIIDLQAPPMKIDNYEEVYYNRNNYAKYYIMSLIEMMKYELEENFSNNRTRELPLVAASLECITKKARNKTGAFEMKIKNLKAKSKEHRKKFNKDLKNKSKKLMEKRKNKLKKQMDNKEKGLNTDSDDVSEAASDANPVDDVDEAEYVKDDPFKATGKIDEEEEQYDPQTTGENPSGSTTVDSLPKSTEVKPAVENVKVDEETEEEHINSQQNELDDDDVKEALQEDEDSDEDEPELSQEKVDTSKDVYFLNIEEKEYPPELKKDAQKDDLWIFMKTRINSTQKLKDINDFIFVKTWWHGLGKSAKIKVKVLGSKSEIKPKIAEYKFALRSTNVGQYANLINNLVAFRDATPNSYLDSVLYINKTSFFEPLMELDRNVVIPMKEYFAKQFNLNMDQD